MIKISLKIYIILFFYSTALTAMDYVSLNHVKTEEYCKLTDEEKDQLSANKYCLNIERSREILKKLAKAVIVNLYIFGNFRDKSAQELAEFELEYTNFLIKEREDILSTTPIEVIDEYTACKRAAQRLSPEEKTALQRKNFIKDITRAEQVIAILAEYIIEELNNKNIVTTINKETFIAEKLVQLKTVYNLN